MENTAKWYVIHTYSGYENKVAQNIEKAVENRRLQHLISEVRVPMEKVVEIKDDGEHEVERKTFPGYVLVKMVMTDESWYVVRNIRGCTGFVGPGSKPIPLTDAEVDALGVENASIEINFAVGDTVKVTAGSLNGFTGTVKAIDLDAQTVELAVSMFGRETPATVAVNQVVKAD